MQVFLGSGLGLSDRPGMTFLGKKEFFHTLEGGGRTAWVQLIFELRERLGD